MNALTAEQIKELIEAGFTKQQVTALKILVQTKEQVQEVATRAEIKVEDAWGRYNPYCWHNNNPNHNHKLQI